MKIKVATTLLLLSTNLILAQDFSSKNLETDTTQLLTEVVVTGTGTEHYIKDAPVQTEVIGHKAIEQLQARSIEDLISGLSASFSFHDGDMGNHIKMNGLANDYILIMIDGKRLNGDIGGQNDLQTINPANIDRIEIVKGAASSLYGSDAIAGVINIITKKNFFKTNISSTTRIGEHADVSESASIGLTFKKVKSITGLHFKHTDGWQNTSLQWNQQQLKSGSTLKTVNKSTNYTISEKLDWNIKKVALCANASFYERWVDRSQGKWTYNPNDFYYRNIKSSLGAKYSLKQKYNLSADVSFDRYGYFYDYKLQEVTDYFIDGERITHYPGQRIKQSIQHQLLAQAKCIFNAGNANLLNVGAEYLYNHLESPHRIDGDEASVFSVALYAQDEFSLLKNTTFTVGARATIHKETGSNISPKIAVLYKLGPLNIRAQYAFGHKTPTIKELYYNYTASLGGGALTAYHGNTGLKAQTSRYASLGLEFLNNNLQISLTGYINKIRNMIELVEISLTSEEKLEEIEKSKEYQNLTKAHIYGADFTINYQILPSLKFSASASFSDPKAQYATKGSFYMKYRPIDATSKFSATATIAYLHAWKKYSLGIDVNGRIQSKCRYIEDNDAEDFQIWKLNTSHAFKHLAPCLLTFNAGVDNIFDYVDRTPFGRNRASNTPGRTVYASLIFKFKKS